MDTLVSVLQRLEAKLDAIDSRPSASRPPRPDPDPPYGMSSEWQAPSWTSEGLATHSVGVSILPWSPTMSSISSWPQSALPRDDYTNGVGFHPTGPHQYPSWEPPRSRAGDYIGHRSSWEQSASQGPSSSYEFDPILGRPRTSWDLPRPRIAPESCSNHSDWDYWVPPTYSESYGGGGGYSKYSNNYNDYYSNEPQAWPYNHESSYSHYGGGYSGGGHANEHSPYVPPPLPPQDSCDVPAPRPIPLSHPQPQHPWGSPGSLTIPNAPQYTIAAERETAAEGERERGVTEMADEEGRLSRAENKEKSICTAAQNGELETVNSFIAAGADVTYSDTEGLTPLMHTAVNGCTEVLKAPLDGGASGNALPPSNVSAGDFDMENNHQSAFDVLLNAGIQAELVFETTTRNENAKGHASGDYWEELADAINVVMEQSYGAPKVAKATSISLHASWLPSIGLVARIELEISKERAWSKMILEVTSPSNGSVKVLKFIFGLYDLAEVYKEFVSPP